MYEFWASCKGLLGLAAPGPVHVQTRTENPTFATSARNYWRHRWSKTRGDQWITPERSIRIVGTDGKHSAIVHDLPNYTSEPSPNSRLVFCRYDNEYLLTQVWTVGQNVARNPLSSKKALESASTGERPETFTVLALADGR